MLEIGAARQVARSLEVVHRQSPKSRTDDDMTEQHVSILEEFAAEVIRLGAEQLDWSPRTDMNSFQPLPAISVSE
jgi:hypothetical protein